MGSVSRFYSGFFSRLSGKPSTRHVGWNAEQIQLVFVKTSYAESYRPVCATSRVPRMRDSILLFMFNVFFNVRIETRIAKQDTQETVAAATAWGAKNDCKN